MSEKSIRCTKCKELTKHTLVINTFPYCLDCYGDVLINEVNSMDIFINPKLTDSCGPNCSKCRRNHK